MQPTSPLRYPGGKVRFTPFIWESIISSGESTKVFIEPFCGGAGVSIALLESEKVDRIALNDCDPLISHFWSIVFGKTCKSRRDINWLINKVESTDITTNEWKLQKALKPGSIREAAWKCLFLNRTSFNGILHRAGPIGGWQQKNRTLDVRFNRERLMLRLADLYNLREQVDRVGSDNWKRFCSYYRRTKDAYLYLDPPYYNRAEQLYGYLFSKKDHAGMRDYLSKLSTPWMLSYDDAPEIRKLYRGLKGIRSRVIDQTYSTHPKGGASHVGRELFFSNRKLPKVMIENKTKIHVGLTVVGCVRTIASDLNGPVRMPIIRYGAVGS